LWVNWIIPFARHVLNKTPKQSLIYVQKGVVISSPGEGLHAKGGIQMNNSVQDGRLYGAYVYDQAVDAACRHGMTKHGAVRMFGVKHTNLQRLLKQIVKQRGRPTQLGDEAEQAIACVFSEFAAYSLPLPASDLSDIASIVAGSFGIHQGTLFSGIHVDPKAFSGKFSLIPVKIP
jgi:hypothetical protein